MKILMLLAALVGALVLGVAALLGVLLVNAHDPAPMEETDVVCAGAPEPLREGDTFTVVSWNLQYGTSRKHRFFYDGGDAVHVPQADADETVAAIAAALQAMGPDIALLQEIDRGSDRTGGVDQLQDYLAALEPACWTATPYHRSVFVPHPQPQMLGRVDMELAILSRYALEGGARHQLAMLDEPWIRQQFNLKRALLEASAPVQGAAPLRLGVTHLSAFSFGDGTLEKQVAQLGAWMGEGSQWVLAGDYNLLPPGDDPARLGSDGESYADETNPIEAIIPAFATVVSPDEILAPEHRTYLPFGADRPDRKIDYVQHGAELSVVEVEVHDEYSHLSDHLPIRVVFRLGPAPTPAPSAAPPTGTKDARRQGDRQGAGEATRRGDAERQGEAVRGGRRR